MTKKEEQAQNCYCYYQNGGKEKVKRHYEITKNLYLENSLQSIQRIIERIRKKKEIEYRRNCYCSITEEYNQTQKDIIKKKII